MPIEIRELQIKATVQDTVAPTEATGASTAPDMRVDEIVAACVEQVMNILKEKEER